MHADTFFSLTTLGTLSAYTIRNEVFEGLVKQEYDDPNAQKVKTAIYCRQFNTAYEGIVKYTREPRQPGVCLSPNEQALIQECTPLPSVSETSWGINMFPEDVKKMREMFKGELDQFSRNIPPGFSKMQQWTSSITNSNNLQFDLMHLRYKIVSKLQAGDWKYVLDHMDSLQSGIEFDPDFLDTDTISLIIETLLVKSHLQALILSVSISQHLTGGPRLDFTSLATSMGYLVFPSVYESVEWIPTRDMVLRRKDVKQHIIIAYLDSRNAKRQNIIDAQTEGARDSSRCQPRRRKFGVSLINPTTNGDNEQPKSELAAVLGESKYILPMVSLEM